MKIIIPEFVEEVKKDEQMPHLSIYAMKRTHGYQTMRVTGTVG